MNCKKVFGENLFSLMEEKKLNIKNFSELTNIPSTNVGVWVNQIYLPNLKNIITISNFFHTSIDYLFDLTDSRFFLPIYEIDFYNTLISILKENRIKNIDFYNMCDICNSQLTTWKKGGLPHVELLLNISLFLNLPIEYIIGRTNKTIFHLC